jgi:O-antigen ligase
MAKAALTMGQPGARPGRPVRGPRLLSPALVVFMMYTAAILTYRLPIGAPAIAAALIFTFFQKGKVRVPPPLTVLLLLSVWLVICSIGSPYAARSFMVLTNGWLKLLVIFFVALNVIRTRAQARLFMVFLLGVFLAFPVRGAIFNWFYGYAPGGRALWNGEFANPNGLGAMSVLMIGIAGGLVVTESKKSPVWLLSLGAIVILPLLVVMTASRGSFIGLAVFVLLVLFGTQHKLRAFSAITIVLLVALLFAPQKALERLGGIKKLNSSDLKQADAEGSASERYALWAVGARIVKDHPMFGVGHAVAPIAVKEYWPQIGYKDLHSVYLTVLAESGPLGLILYLTIIGLVLRKTHRVRKLAKLIEPRTEWQLRCLEIGLVAFLVTAIWGAQPFLILFFLQLAVTWSVADVTERSLIATLQAQRSQAPLPQNDPPPPRVIGIPVSTRSMGLEGR